MAYLVIAAGAVMVLFGALAIITGYPIIQIERGWTTVIAGTSLLAGGVVTIALALVLRALTDLRHALVHAGPAEPRPAVAAPADIVTDVPIVERAPYASIGLAAVPAAAALAMERPATAHAEPVLEPAHEAESDDAHPVDAVAPALHAEPPRPADAGHPADKEAPPASDDWFDRAFADLAFEPPPPIAAPARAVDGDVALAPHHDEHHPGAIETLDPPHAHDGHDHDNAVETHAQNVEATRGDRLDEGIHHAHDHDHREFEMADAVPADSVAAVAPEPTSHVDPHAAPAPAHPAEPAVIGRYEADGTSYTMFADGSIEAQSEAGIYRFASMSELKAFIEG